METETVTVHERMVAVMEGLGMRDAIDFEAVLVRPDGQPPSRALIVTTFLAILELTRLAALRLYQSVNENGVPIGPIHLRRAEDADQVHWRERIAEIM